MGGRREGARAVAALATAATMVVGACGDRPTSPAREVEGVGEPRDSSIENTSLVDASDVFTDANPSAHHVDAGDATSLPECTFDFECASGMCGTMGAAAGKCLVARSCNGSSGTYACGPAGNENCCTSLPLPGGSYLRNNKPTHPATVSGFTLDKYEITVGRIRAFVNAYGGNLRANAPAPGAGAHPKIASSGWRSSWNVRLPASFVEIDDRLGPAGCTRGGVNSDGGTATWTPTPGPYEDKPITCIDWYTLFMFCHWDGGRIPTDAELGYAALGGEQQREHAWGTGEPYFSTHRDLVVAGLPDPTDGLTKQTWGPLFRTRDATGTKFIGGPEVIAPPGRKPLGNGRWGHSDLTGNVLEWTLDEAVILEGECSDCARTDWPDPPQDQVGFYPPQWPLRPEPGVTVNVDGARSVRGGSWDPTHVLSNWSYYAYDSWKTYASIGGRCARD